MSALGQRLLGFMIGLDEALNALGGGSPKQTISGTIGRGLAAGAWWAPFCRWVVDGLLGQGHCARAVANEPPIQKT